MDEMKKEYAIVGSVTIGTDEYKDLIVGAEKAKAERDRYMHEYWNAQTKVKELETERDKLRAELVDYKRYIVVNHEQDELELFLLRSKQEG